MINKTKGILVADRDPTIRRLVADVYRNSEFQVHEAGDGVEALKRIDTFCDAIEVKKQD